MKGGADVRESEIKRAETTKDVADWCMCGTVQWQSTIYPVTFHYCSIELETVPCDNMIHLLYIINCFSTNSLRRV